MVTVVEAEVVEVTVMFAGALQDEKEKGPVGDVLSDTATPLSYQLSPVGDVMEIRVVPLYVVVAVQPPLTEPEIVVPETEAPEQVFDE